MHRAHSHRPHPPAPPMRGRCRFSFVFLGSLLLGALVVIAQPTDLQVTLRPLVEGLIAPVHVTHAGDGTGRLFVVEQRGTVRIVQGGTLRPGFFLDLRAITNGNGEQGLLGLAFHPDYRTNGRLFVHYTNLAGNSRVASLRVSASNPDRADPASRVTLLAVPQPFGNHNGGHLAFGPDGMLYIALGDGGSAGDPGNNAQNRNNLLGAVLRIDVDSATPYAIPPDNPFVGQADVRGEIFVYGLRNPWRFSFDRANGDLFLGDVGQNAWEEIDRVPAGTSGTNFGWRVTEGPDCFSPSTGCVRTGLAPPILSYDHRQGSSVTGGYRYRGTRFPAMRGVYFYGDFISGRLWGATPTANGWRETVLLDTGRGISGFGEDELGELYLLDYFTGSLLRITAAGDGGDGGGGCPLPAGHPRLCTDCGPCGEGAGDCDRDDECAAGLRCVDNVGTDFGFAPGIDVCLADDGTPPTGCSVAVGSGRYCTDCGPCAVGEGDCDRDSECVADLVCADNIGAQFGFAPGVDVCVAPGGGDPGGCPLPVGHPRFCTECGPCAAGEGDCDSNADCRQGLVCADNVGPMFGFGGAIDVCVAP